MRGSVSRTARGVLIQVSANLQENSYFVPEETLPCSWASP